MSDRIQFGITAGSTSVSLRALLRKTSDHTEQTGKVAADMTLSYWRQGGVRVAVAATNLAAVDSAHSAGGVKEVDTTNMPGDYRIDWPDAAFATGADWVELAVKVAGCFVAYDWFALSTLLDPAVLITNIVTATYEKALPGGFAEGTAGYKIGTFLDASTRARARCHWTRSAKWLTRSTPTLARFPVERKTPTHS